MKRNSGTVRRSVTARAPGRVNLIGEHTDYNDGFVLPMGLPFDTTIAMERRDDRTVNITSVGWGETSFSLDDDPGSVESWARYLAAMGRLLAEEGLPVPGVDVQMRSTIPGGASLSSSAALEVAAGFAFAALCGREPDPVHMAKLGQRVENEVIGIQSGIMDQLISATAREGSASLIDCRSLESSPVELPTGTRVLIMDTMTRRELADSEYDLRRQACERAAAAIGVPALRDATADQLDLVEDPTDRRRAGHVIAENERVLQAVDAMQAGDLAQLGALMNESHRSLSEDYEVSSEALDQISAIAREHDGTIGARMTGGGFGGAAVALVHGAQAEDVAQHVISRYEHDTGRTSDLWSVVPSEGASIVSVED